MLRFPGRRSGLIAKDRLKLLLTSERLDCTPQMMTMLQNDMIRAVNKYFAVREPERGNPLPERNCYFYGKNPLTDRY